MLPTGKRVIDTRSRVASTGGTGTTTVDHRIIEIEGMFKEAYAIMVTEYTYVSGVLSSIDVWSSVDKLTKLFTKTFTYENGNVRQIELLDLRSGYRLVTTFTYSNGSLVAKHRILE